MPFLLAVLTAGLGSVPAFVCGMKPLGKWLLIVGTPLLWLIYYLAAPPLVWPLWGAVGLMVLIFWAIPAAIDIFMRSAGHDRDGKFGAWWPALALVLVFGVRGMVGCSVFRANDYANLIGEVDRREWTQDVQPKDPRHVRLVPEELALWLADKQLGEAPGAIGSQFEISREHLTLQMIKGELWYVVPLDYRTFRVWTSVDYAPGYIMVSAENPLRPVVVKTDERFVYTPGAFFSQNLHRHLWQDGYYNLGLEDYTLEIDEDGKAWWVVTVFEPSIAWWGKRVRGALIVDPETGTHRFYNLRDVPVWVDRVIPQNVVRSYVTYWGEYRDGWWNSVWSHHNIIEPEEPTFVYGSDGQPYWVSCLTSSSEHDQSLVGLIYTNSRTGESVLYHAVGGTEQAVLTAVNNQVAYRRWHGASPVLYNIYGTMASVVPLLGESHTFQGVAIVRMNDLQVAVGETPLAAAREYQRLIGSSTGTVGPDPTHQQTRLRGRVDRFAAETGDGSMTYYLHLEGVDHIFVGSSELSAKLPLTRVGDEVEITFIQSEESVVPMISFDNLSLPLGR